MAIYINGRFLTKKLTGIQRYSMEVLKALDELQTKEEIILLYPRNIIYDLNFKKIKKVELKFLNGNLWEQITIPFYLFWKKNVKLISMFNSAPILRPDYVVLHDIAFVTHNSHLTKKFIMWYKFMTRLNIKRYKHIFTVSEFSKKEIIDVYKVLENKVTITYNSADHLKNIKPDEKIISKLGLTNKKFCFSLGSKSKHKNHKYIEQLAINNPDIIFVVSGGGNNRVLKGDTFIELENMIITGYINDNELVALYKNCECFIFPSLYEGFGIPPLEALVVGCPKIAISPLPVLKEIYGDNAFYLDFEGKDKYNIKKIIEQKKNIDYSKFDEYSWKVIAEKILNEMEK